MLKNFKKALCFVVCFIIFLSLFTVVDINNSSVEASSKIKITWMGFGQPHEKELYTKLVKKFMERYKNITVDYICTAPGQEYGMKIQAAMASGKLPDVFYVPPENLRAWVDAGKLLKITKYVKASKEINLNNIWPQAISRYMYDGKTIGKGDIYALPKDVGPFAFGYNKTMFKKEGIPLPDPKKPYTWNEFVEICKKVTKDTNGDGKLDQWGTDLDVNWTLHMFVWSNGADWLDSTKTKVTIDDPKFIEALQFFADLRNKYKVTPTAVQGQSISGYQRWLNGQLAFFPVGPWDVPVYNKLKFEYDLIPPPVSPKTKKPATWLGSLGFGVASTTKYPQQAVDLAAFLSTDREGQRMAYQMGLQIPNLIDMAKNEYVKWKEKPNNKMEFIRVIEDYGRRFPFEYTYDREWYDTFYSGLQPVLDGKMTAEQYCKQVKSKIQKLLDKANQKAKK